MLYINHVKIHPFPSPSFRTALSKPRNLSYFPLKIRSRPKKGENRPRLRTERFGSWVSKIARLIEDTTQKTSTNFSPQRYQPSRVTTLQKHRHPAYLRPQIGVFFISRSYIYFPKEKSPELEDGHRQKMSPKLGDFFRTKFSWVVHAPMYP